MSALEESMLIGMHLFGKILTVKVMMMPEKCGLGFVPSAAMKE